MKSILRKILIGNTPLKEYSTITIEGNIREKVFLQIDGKLVDISKSHWLLCLEPVVFGVWMANNEQIEGFDKNKMFKIFFTNGIDRNGIDKNLAKVTLNFFDKIEEKEGTLFLLKLKKSGLFHLNLVKIFLLYYRYYKKPRFSFRQFKGFVSAYSYPRMVNLISFRQGDYYNIFPMDLTGEPRGTNWFVFGLRHTNLTLSKIIEYKKLVKSDVSFEHKEIIYQLGKHHGTIPPPVDALPFPVLESEQFEFYIPSWIEKYREIEIIRTMNLGSHMLLWGKLVNEKIVNQPVGHLFHIHFLLYLSELKSSFSYPLA